MDEEGNGFGTELCPLSTAAVCGVLSPGVGRKLYLPGSVCRKCQAVLHSPFPHCLGLHRSAVGQASEQTCYPPWRWQAR